ncbi:MAG: hypothetical protein HZA92_14685 [Verrucomicrobia bacterium]|nr:hypothetical protein [Verrucomicrobiota bacterium]
MRTVLHIFLKDVRQMRWTLAMWLAQLAVQLASAHSAKQTTIAEWDILTSSGPKVPIWTLLHWLGLVVIVFEVLLADRAFGTEPCWKTRPIARWQMAAAKLGFVSFFLVALPVGIELGLYHAHGVPMRQVAVSAWIPLLGQAYAVSWMVLLALFCRRRTVEVVVLAALALAAPIGVFALYGFVHMAVLKWQAFQQISAMGWDRAPDYLAYPVTYHLRMFVAMGLLPVVGLAVLGCQGYLLQQRTRTLGSLGALLLIWVVIPFPLMLQGIATANPRRDAPVHRFTPADVGLTVDWKQLHPSSRPFTLLEGTLRLPELPAATGPLALLEMGQGHTKLHLSHGAERVPRFTLPDMNPERLFASRVQMPGQDVFVNRALMRTNGAHVAWLGPQTVLNPVTIGSVPTATLEWGAERSLTNFTHAAVELRVEVVESECRIVGRMPFAEFRAQNPTTNAEPTNAEPDAAAFTDPRYTVTTVTRQFGWGNPMGYSDGAWATTTARKAVLWHPKRREVLLPSTGNAAKDGPYGVLAMVNLKRVEVHTQTSHFPHTPKGKEPQPGAPGPEWFAEAELLLLSFRYVTNSHQIILVPDVKLPPVPPSPSMP